MVNSLLIVNRLSIVNSLSVKNVIQKKTALFCGAEIFFAAAGWRMDPSGRHACWIKTEWFWRRRNSFFIPLRQMFRPCISTLKRGDWMLSTPINLSARNAGMPFLQNPGRRTPRAGARSTGAATAAGRRTKNSTASIWLLPGKCLAWRRPGSLP